MSRFLAFALAALSLPAAPVNAAAHKRPSLASVCSGEALPFPVPDDVGDITDSAFESWEAGAWSEYCADARPGSYAAKACACRPDFD